MKKTIAVITLFFAGLALFSTGFLVEGTSSAKKTLPPEDPIAVKNDKAIATAPPAIPVFIESAASKGIIFEHQDRAQKLTGITNSYGSGVCILDFNRDNFDDIFIVGGNGNTRRYGKKHWWKNTGTGKLYQNIGGDYFRDASDSITGENPALSLSGYGCASGDLNNDDFPDLIFGNLGKITLLINNQGKGFTPRVIELENERIWPMSVTLWDWNRDGLQDIFVAAFTTFFNDIKVGAKDYGYQQLSQFQSKNFAGQTNFVLTSQAGSANPNQVTFAFTRLENIDRSLSLTPLQLLFPEHNILADSRAEESLSSPETEEFFVNNATGSNSRLAANKTSAGTTQGIPYGLLEKVKTPSLQLSTLTLQDKPALLVTRHQGDGYHLYPLSGRRAGKETENTTNQAHRQYREISWNTGLNSVKDNASQHWASLVGDINNDGQDDIISARGFITPHINNPYKTQGSINSVKLQTGDGNFISADQALIPQLARSSRGAALADFNNDGFIDIAFNNNNDFFSLYINSGTDNNWLSFICRPTPLCQGSRWQLSAKDGQKSHRQFYISPQPFLSGQHKRLHFGLADNRAEQQLEVSLERGEKLAFPNLTVNRIYQVDLAKQTITPLPVAARQKTTESQDAHARLTALLGSNTEELLAELAILPPQDIEALTLISGRLLHYKMSSQDKSFSQSREHITLISWLLTQALTIGERQDNDSQSADLWKNIIALIGKSESSLFISPMLTLIDKLPEQQFCQLSEQVHHWFWEEEIAPESKQLLKAPLLRRLTTSDNPKITICGLYALGASEDTSIGHSLLPLLSKRELTQEEQTDIQHSQAAEQALLIPAAAMRTLGQLKYAKGQHRIKQLCESSHDPLFKAECIITSYKMANTGNIDLEIKLNAMDLAVFALHPDKVLLARYQKSLKVAQGRLLTAPGQTGKAAAETVKAYSQSPLATHYLSAHLFELTSAKTPGERNTAMAKLALRTPEELANIARKWHQLAPKTLDGYADMLIALKPVKGLGDGSWLLPYISSKKLVQLLNARAKAQQTSSQPGQFSLPYQLAYQCSIRKSIYRSCQQALKLNAGISAAELSTVIEKSPEKLIYSQLTADKTRQRIFSQKLYAASKALLTQGQEQQLARLFNLLHVNNSYLLLGKQQITRPWLKAFMELTLKQQKTLDKSWLDSYKSHISEKKSKLAALLAA